MVMVCGLIEAIAYLAYVVIGTCGFILSSFLAYAYLRDPVLYKCPGGLVTVQLIYQAIYDMHFISGWPFIHE